MPLGCQIDQRTRSFVELADVDGLHVSQCVTWSALRQIRHRVPPPPAR
jgi:hypothetical protein